MEAAIRFSQNCPPGRPEQHFLKIDVAGRVLQVYNVTGEHKGKLQYDLVYASGKLQPFRAFDWHPTDAALVAVGQLGGEASLVNLRDTDQSPVAFTVRSQRSCNAVGLNTKDWLAVGLDKVRNDFCLNVWDVNQKTSASSSRIYGKSSSEPLHKLAAGEPITSLRFYHDHPQLLAAGVKGQFIRLYDLRESVSATALQFSTRCVNNIALNTQDENYIASCLPATHPTVALWDRRMVGRANVAQVGFGNYVAHTDRHPEASAELKSAVDPKGQIWGLRFSKTSRLCLGVLSSTGQLRALNYGVSEESATHDKSAQYTTNWETQTPQDIFLDHSNNVTNAYYERPAVDESSRVVSFDFTTASSSRGRPKIITLSGDGNIATRSLVAPGGVAPRSSLLEHTHMEPRDSRTEAHRSSMDSSRSTAISVKDNSNESVRPSTTLKMQARCNAGYLLDAEKNTNIVRNDAQLYAFWSWLRHAESIAKHDTFCCDDVDMSYAGIYDIWMEAVDTAARNRKLSAPATSAHLPTILRDLAQKLGLVRGRGCATEYPHNRALCLYVLGLPRTRDGVEEKCRSLVDTRQTTQAAALALFAGELKLAQKLLRATAGDKGQKVLAMALAGADARHKRLRSSSHNSDGSTADTKIDHSEDEDWKELIVAVAEEITDCFAKAILAFVKSGNWSDVVSQPCLPLQYRLYVALRHFEDARLTRYLSDTKSRIIQSGDLEGVIVTGLGNTDYINLMEHYVTLTNDVQTAALAMSFGAASDRFLSSSSAEYRSLHSHREYYKKSLLASGLKFEKVRFDVAVARQFRQHKIEQVSRKKEQIRLVCAHCNQSIAQFGEEQQINAANSEAPQQALTPEKAAVIGVVCPKCGKHLPRCGVCDLWLGTPDESFSKWYKPSAGQRTSTSVDLSASLVGSTITAIGPSSNAPSVAITGVLDAKKLSTADLPSEAIEVVDEDLARQEREKQWWEAMHRFTIFCTMCSHGFHAEHAKQWFEGVDGRKGQRVCPVPLCECLCNG